ncbi:MAG: putative porin [Pseudomonadota bacterium]|nr:putative porin [Pseudomonadota bacterium]
MNLFPVISTCTLIFLASFNAFGGAHASDNELTELKQTLDDAMSRIAEFEASDQTVVKSSWSDRIRLKGDFRYRYQNGETTDRLDALNLPIGDRDRNRQRVRARADLIADIHEDIEVGFGVATGGDDPVSTNQTLGGAGSSKGLQMDLAYMNWKLSNNSGLYLGKFKNQFSDVAGTGILWDSDWRPEGFNTTYEKDNFYANFLGTWLTADGSSGSGSSFNYGLQIGVTTKISDAKVDVGAGIYRIKGENRQCYNASSDRLGDDCFGNTEFDHFGAVAAGGGFYGMDYSPMQLFGKAALNTVIPVTIFFDYIVNLDAKLIPNGPSAGQKLDSAYLIGASLGYAKQQGEWQIKGYYQEKEADSLLGLLTESDFAGGGTDSEGLVFKAKYMLKDAVTLQATYLMGERQDSNGYENGNTNTSNPYDVDILQLDVKFKY